MTEITLKRVRVSFPNWFVPAAAMEPGKPPSYNGHFIIAKDDPQMAALKAGLIAVAKAKWGDDKGLAIAQGLFAQGRVCLRDGNTKLSKETGEVLEGYKDMMFVSGGSKTRPPLVDRDPKVALEESHGKLLSGDYCNVKLQLWAQDNPGTKGGRRLNAHVMGIQFVERGERFGSGGRFAKPDDFETLPEIYEDQSGTAAAAPAASSDLF